MIDLLTYENPEKKRVSSWMEECKKYTMGRCTFATLTIEFASQTSRGCPPLGG